MYSQFTKFAIVAALLALHPGVRGATYQEVGGVVVVEAEHFDNRTTEDGGTHHYVIVPDEDPGLNPMASARGGRYMQNLPDAGQNRNSDPSVVGTAPYLDFKVQINTTGDYKLYLRDIGFDGGSDSVYAQILEVASPQWYRYGPVPNGTDFSLLQDDPNDSGTVCGWNGYGAKEAVTGNGGEEPAIWTISKAGTYTIRLSQREDGNSIDALIFQLNSLPRPTDPGPPESQIVGAPPAPLSIYQVIPVPDSKAARFDTPVTVIFADGTTKLATNSVVLKLDGTPVTPTITQQAGSTTVKYQPPAVFAALSSHTATVSYSDDKGGTFSKTWSFAIQNYVSLGAAQMVTADKTKPGFVWDMSQVDNVGSDSQNSNQRTIDQLAGLLGPNIADPSAQGVATAAGVPDKDPNLPIHFEIPTVLNISKTGATTTGDFTPDDQMPGSPGTNGGTDNQAARVVTYIDLPAGTIRMGVNSDDGFLTRAGLWNDAFTQTPTLGQFDGGRGAADTTFTFVVPQAGTYAFFTLWENGGGDANIEWFTLKADGTRVLLNDSTNGGFKSYRALAGGTNNKATARTLIPAPGATDAPFDQIQVVLVDGASPIDKSTVKLKVDNAAVTPSISKTGSVTTVLFSPNPVFAPTSTHTAELDYTEGGSPVTHTWSFTVVNYVVLTPDLAVKPDTTKPGFLWNMSEVDSVGSDTQNSNKRTEDQLAGKLGPNIADPSVAGVALGAGKANTNPNLPIAFQIPTVINLSKTGGTTIGNFTPDDQMPGSPGTAGGTDNQAAEIITYLDLPAGTIHMGVNSDDGFRTEAGPYSNPSQTMLGEFDGGRGAADTLFSFVVQQAGVYSFRTIWENGGGDSNIEWYTIKPDGTKVLLNDSTNGGYKAYRAATPIAAPTAPKITGIKVSGTNLIITWTGGGSLQEATVEGPGTTWTDVAGATTSPATIPIGSNKDLFIRVKE